MTNPLRQKAENETANKRCSKCLSVKTIANFNKSTRDGRNAWCKPCELAANLRRSHSNWSKTVAERRRYYLEHREHSLNLKSEWYYNGGKELVKKNNKRWRARHNPKDRLSELQKTAYRIYNNAKRRGDLIPQPCKECGSKIRIHGHHTDYSKPLDVIWLCSFHHQKTHGMKHRKLGEGKA